MAERVDDRRAQRGRPSRARAQELRRAHRRAAAAKGALASLGAVVFGAGMIFARHSFAGHTKERVVALEVPPRFSRVVEQDLLQAGVVGPAQAPPEAVTAAS